MAVRGGGKGAIVTLNGGPGFVRRSFCGKCWRKNAAVALEPAALEMRARRPNLAVFSALQTRFCAQHLIKDTGREFYKTKYLSHPRRRVPSAKQRFACLSYF